MVESIMGQKIISSNIRFNNPADNDDAWPLRKTILVETLLKHSPTLISTQEGRQEQLEELEYLLPNYTMVAANRNWITQRMYPCLFLKNEDWTVNDSGDKWLSLTPDEDGSFSFESTFPRLFTWAHLTQKNTGKNFFVVNTHIDHILETTRLSQVEVLTGEMVKLIHADEFIILTGDFNDTPTGKVREHLMSLLPFVNDPWIDLNKQEETSFHPFTGVNPEGYRIDWILVDKRIKCSDIFLDKTEKSGKYPSDHFPLVCDLSI